jgi:hypothetical protein
MTDEVIKRKMNQIANLCDELDEEAKRRHGKDGFFFFEAEGYFQIMDGDSESGRQNHIRLQSDTPCKLAAGAW